MANLIRRRNEPERGREMAPFGATSWNPLRMMNEMLRFDPFGELAGAPLATSAFVPRFDVKETKDSFLFTADLPGLKEEEVEVSLAGNTLTISGRRQEEETSEGDQYHWTERSWGEFRRSFTLPEGADAAQADADLKNGVLRVRVPKRAEVQSRRIALGGGKGGSGAKA